MTQKSFAEAMRALVIYTCHLAGQGRRSPRVPASDHELAEAVNDLLLPIVKGYGSERSWVLLGTESLQTFGGSGFLQEYPIEQYVRDAKIDTLYEGTTAIQGHGLLLPQDRQGPGQGAGPPRGPRSSRSSSPVTGNGRAEERARAARDGTRRRRARSWA
jgi:hypothetical protein